MSRRLALATFAVFLCATIWATGIASAQDRPVIFLHGLLSTGSTWNDTVERLRRQLAIDAHNPTTGWADRFEQQGKRIRNEVPQEALVDPVLVGHSNGGLVAREFAKRHTLQGLVTLSSPNLGAPIASNARAFGSFVGALFSDIARAQHAFAKPYDNEDLGDAQWVFSHVVGPMNVGVELAEFAIETMARLGSNIAVPVHVDDRLGSPFLNELNSPAGVANETANARRRVSIVTSVPESHIGGPARAMLPGGGWVPIHWATYASIGILDAWALHLASNGDAGSFDRAEKLMSIALWLTLFEPYWCQAITDPTPYAVSLRGSCHINDTFLPSWSHVLPGSLVVPQFDTFAHTQQPSELTPLLYEVLTAHMGVAPRTAAPTAPSTLTAGQSLREGEQLFSPDRRYRLVYQGDGNLVLYFVESNRAVWSSGTWNTVPGVVTMQEDGNFVVYDAGGQARWHTYTWGHAGAHLALRNNGSIAVTRADGTAIWATLAPAWELDDPGDGGGGDEGGGGAGTDTLTAADRLYPGQAVTSRNGRHSLTYQADGNLVLYGPDGAPRWSTQVFSSPGYAELQIDGNFVTYDAGGTPTWASGTAGLTSARLVVLDDGDVVINTSAGVTVWSTGTGGS